MADKPPNLATSSDDDVWPDVDTTPPEFEHQLLGHGTCSPDWEQTTAMDPEHDDEASGCRFAPTGHHAIEPQVNDTTSFGPEHPSLWHEIQAVDRDWAAEHEEEPGLDEGIDTGVYLRPNHTPPSFPTLWHHPQPFNPGFTSWYPPQPPPTSVRPSHTPNTSMAPNPTYDYHYPAPLLFPHYRAPRQRCEYRPPRTPKTHRECYHLP